MGGGKGGIGKSLITANIATLLAQKGRQVILVDLDLGGSNLHTFIGLDNPGPGLADFLDKRVAKLQSVAVPTEVDGLTLVNSANCRVEAANLHTAQKEKIIRSVQSLTYDYVFMDLGAGTNFNLLDFFLASDQGLFVLTSEPTAIENAFTFIKAVYFRMIKRTLKQKKFNRMTRHMDLNANTLDQSFRILKAIRKQQPETADALQEKLEAFQFSFIVNKVHKHDDPYLGEKIEKVCNHHFYSRFKFLGNIRYDEKIHDAVLRRRLFVTRYAYTPVANDINQIVSCLEALNRREPLEKNNETD